MTLIATPTRVDQIPVGVMVDIPSIEDEYAVVRDSQPTGSGEHILVVTVGGGLAAVPMAPDELVHVISYGFSNVLETASHGRL